MIKDINHISFEGAFRIWFEENCTGIWWEGLPDDVHFTLSHRPQDAFANLHVSRNIGDPKNKPKIEIARLHKNACLKMLEAFTHKFLHQGWEKIPLDLSKVRHRKSLAHHFLPLDELQYNKRFFKLREGMATAFRKSSRVKRKNRLKIFKSLEQEMEQLIHEPRLQKIFYKSFRKLPRCPTDKPKAGILVCPEYTGCVVLMKGGIYQLKRSALPEILRGLIQPELYADFLSFIPFAISQVSIAKTYQETEHLDNPYPLQMMYPQTESLL